MYLIEAQGDQVSCRVATAAETLELKPAGVPMHVIYPSPGQIATSAGLKITLQSTTQLDGFPDAKAAFVRAAQIWESRIANPATVVIDVDFGPTRFGTPYPSPNILGSTSSNSFNGAYSLIRSLVLSGANKPSETTLYNALPATSIPTDLGSAAKGAGTRIQLTALGATLPTDTRPSIGFNSAFSFDLDPSNGIDPNQFDFEAVTVHEIGHALGFGSAVGATEPMENNTSASEVIPTIWDLFRFRPGITTGTFTTAQRPMSSGGTHVSFVDGASIQMSTGRPDGSGGDEQQASHWKDNTGGNPFIGLMDPTIPRGTRQQLTDADMAAFDLMGYTIASGNAVPPAAPSNLTATATSSSVIRLNWSDNSGDETEFRVERKFAGGVFQDIGAAQANSTSIDVTDFSPSTTVTFRVRARNGSGDSAYSNEATATTFSTGGGGCTPNTTTVCLLSDRFRVSIAFLNQFANPPQPGNFLGAKLVAGVQNPDVATFGISSAQAIEVVVRIQDTRPFGLNRFDIYYGGLTDLEYTVTVTDVTTGATKTYRNAPGTVGGGVDRTTFTAVLGPGDRLTSGGSDSFYVNELPGGTATVKGTPARLREAERVQVAAVKRRANAGGGGACAEVEPNETLALADVLNLNEPCTGQATLGDAFQYAVGFDDPSIPDGQIQDVFVFTTSGGPVTATLTFSNGAADLDLYLMAIVDGSLEVIGDSLGTTTTESIALSSLPAGTYYVGVSAFDGGSAYALTVNASAAAGAPAAPTGLTATAISTSQIRLNWTDNANNETEYRIEARSGGSGFTDLGPLAADTTFATVSGIPAGTAATFRVRARNASGDSAYSNEASATTFSTGGGSCTPNATTVCLLSDRFRVSIAFINQFATPPQPGNFLGGKLVAGVQNPDVATFGISSAQAIEVVVRIQDTRPFGLNRFDIYYGGLTDLEYTVSVTDVTTGVTKTYRNAPGTVGGGVDRTTFTAN